MAKVKAAPVVAAPSDEVAEYPKAMYHKEKASKETPNGYRVKRVESAEEEADLGTDWKHSPADL